MLLLSPPGTSSSPKGLRALVCVCIYIHIFMKICVYIYTYTYNIHIPCASVHVQLCIAICSHGCVYVYTNMIIHVCICMGCTAFKLGQDTFSTLQQQKGAAKGTCEFSGLLPIGFLRRPLPKKPETPTMLEIPLKVYSVLMKGHEALPRSPPQTSVCGEMVSKHETTT